MFLFTDAIIAKTKVWMQNYLAKVGVGFFFTRKNIKSLCKCVTIQSHSALRCSQDVIKRESKKFKVFSSFKVFCYMYLNIRSITSGCTVYMDFSATYFQPKQSETYFRKTRLVLVYPG